MITGDNGQPVECDVCDFENAKLVSRAKWCCPNCGRDYSLEYIFWAQAAHPEWLDELPNGEVRGASRLAGEGPR